jgi:superfamily II DNA or RNA helicase
MCMGIDIPEIDVIIISRPFQHLHMLIQAAGRGGRKQTNSKRRRVIVYLLYNRTDLRSNCKTLSESVRNLYNTKACIKDSMNQYFNVGGPSVNFVKHVDWCCSTCSQ